MTTTPPTETGTQPIALAMQRCRRCGTVDALTRTVCTRCLGDAFDCVGVEGTGTLVSWTTIRRAPTQFRDDVPYDVCVVDLANGQRVTGRLSTGVGASVGAAVIVTDLRGETPIFSSLQKG